MRQPKMKIPDSAIPDADMRTSRYPRSHLAVRLMVTINLTHLALSFYEPYYRATHRLFCGNRSSLAYDLVIFIAGILRD
jgi:hypothetical protein